MREWFGSDSQWNHAAGSLETVAEVKRALRSVVSALSRRIARLEGVDARLAQRAEHEIEDLRFAISKIKRDGSGLPLLVARLIRLLAVLLGYDWMQGKPNRQLRYSQTVEQVALDDRKASGQNAYLQHKGIEERRARAIEQARSAGWSVPQVALVFKVSEEFVVDTLRRLSGSKDAF